MKRWMLFFLFSLILLQTAVSGAQEHPLDFARRLFSDGLYDAASNELETFLKENPQSPYAQEARFLAGTSLHLLGDCERSVPHLSRYLDKPEDNLRAGEASYRLGECLLITGDFDSSTEAFERVRRDFPESEFSGVALVGAAEAYSKAGNFEAALGYFDNAISEHPDSEFAPRAYFGRGLARASVNQFDLAIRDLSVFRDRYTDDPLRPYALLMAARVYLLNLQDASSARELFELLRTDYHSQELEPQAALGISQALMIEKKHVEAQNELMSLLANYQDPGIQNEARWILGGVYLDSGSIAKSAETDSLALSTGTRYADMTRVRLAESLLMLERFESAITTFEGFAPQDPVLAIRALEIQAESYYRTGRYDDAIVKLEEVYESDASTSQRTNAGYRIAEIFATDLNQGSLASYWYDKIIRTFGKAAGAQSLFQQASLLEQAGEYLDALTNYQRILDEYQRSPLVAEAASRMSSIKRLWLVNKDSAIRNLVSILHGGGSRDPRLSLASVYEQDLKDFDRAISYMNAYLSECDGCTEELLKKAKLLLLSTEKLEAEMRFLDGSDMKNRAMATLAQVIEQDPAGDLGAEASLLTIRTENESEPLTNEGRTDAWEDFLDVYGKTGFRDVALYELATSLMTHGVSDEDAERAETLLGELVDYHPSSQHADDARMMLGKIYLSRKLGAEALSQFQRVLFDYPNSSVAVDAVYGIGVSGGIAGDLLGSLGAFQRVVNDYRFDEDVTEKAWIGMCETLFDLRRAGEAHDSMQVFLSLYPESEACADAGLLAANIYHQLGRPVDALLVLDEVIGAGNDSLNMKALELARSVSLSSGYFHDGAKLGKRILEDDSTNEDALSFVSELMIYAGQAEEAIELLGGIESAENLSPALQVQMARALLRTDNDRAAENILKKIEKSLPKGSSEIAIVKLERAESWFAKSEYGDAKDAFTTVAEDFKGTEWEDDALLGVGKCQLLRKDYANARTTFQDIVSRFPSSVLLSQVYLKLGSAYFFDEMYAEARDAYALSTQTAHTADVLADAFFNLALACERLSDWQCSHDASLKVLETSAPIDLRASAIFKAGYALQELAQYSDAISYYRQALSGANQELSAEIRYWMGECYAAMGDYTLAISEFLKVAYLYSGEGMWGVTAELRAASVYEMTGEVVEARKIYNRVLENYSADSIWGKTAAEKLGALSGGN